MPELPEIVAYIDALQPRIGDEVLEDARIRSFSLLRTFDPPIESAFGKRLLELRRLGKRIVFGFEDDLFMVLHLMVAGRLHWHEEKKAIPAKVGLAAFDYSSGTLLLTEAGTKRRASLHVVSGEAALAELDPGGIELTTATVDEFASALQAERHTLKRALTDARHISGIGGAFADEILHRARLSPLQMNTNLSEDELARLFSASVSTLEEWIEIRRGDVGDGFPEKVTAFDPMMAVHGKYGESCPVCGTTVQRIVYSSRETNYCPGCQTDGRILADRSLSRLLKDDWPKTIEELEE
ncbi:MAG: DNA-formamidopyrimidine glycosylase family protein [Acidimicrobiia bacterium]|nr:DNA-formamidopyrimidine glycosylase family protein [Acidimicrobiia bacterium]